MIRSYGGTLILSVLTPTAAYIAADSRYVREGEPAIDSAEKIVLIDEKSACALSGYIRFVRSVAYSNDYAADTALELSMIVEDIAMRSGATREAGAEGFARALHARLLPIWNVFAGNLTRPFLASEANPHALARIVYVTTYGKNYFQLARIGISHSVSARSDGSFSSTPQYPEIQRLYEGRVRKPLLYAFGCRELRGQESACDITSDAQAQATIMNFFTKSILERGANGPIGGAIDIARVNAEGVRWLRHKDSTNDQRQASGRAAGS